MPSSIKEVAPGGCINPESMSEPLCLNDNGIGWVRVWQAEYAEQHNFQKASGMCLGFFGKALRMQGYAGFLEPCIRRKGGVKEPDT